MRRRSLLAAAALLAAGTTSASAAETVRLGVTKIVNCAPIAIAMAKGYFTAEGIDPKLTFFEAQAPIAVAVASGDLDAGTGAETAALYNLALGGRVKVIAAGAAEAPSFDNLAVIASNKAYAAGLKTPRDLPGHSFALTQMGTGLQYSLGEIAEKLGFDVKTVTLLPLQSNPNIASALVGGRADSAVFDSTNALPLLERGDVKLLGWVGDIAGITQAYLTFASRDMVDNHAETTRHFLAAFRHGVEDYYDAFTDADGKRKDGPDMPAILDIMAKYVDQPPERVKQGLPYFDREARLRVAEIQHQLDWYKSIGAIKGEARADLVLDARYVVTRP